MEYVGRNTLRALMAEIKNYVDEHFLPKQALSAETVRVDDTPFEFSADNVQEALVEMYKLIGKIPTVTWYPSDIGLLFEHFANKAPTINTIDYVTPIVAVQDLFSGSINPSMSTDVIDLHSLATESGSIFASYSINGSTTAYQRLLSAQWNLNGTFQQRVNVYASPNSSSFMPEDASSTHALIAARGFFLLTYDRISVDFYYYNQQNVIQHISLTKDASATLFDLRIGNRSNNDMAANAFIWNIGYIQRKITSDEITKIIEHIA